MTEQTTTRTPARITLAFMLFVAAAGVAVGDMLLTHDLAPSIVGSAVNLPNRIIEVMVWVLIAVLALFRNRFARIILLVMTMASGLVFFSEKPYPLDSSSAALWTTVEFGIRLLACGLLFTRRADTWYARVREEKPKSCSLPRTLYVLGTSVLIVVVMAVLLAVDAASFGMNNALFGMTLWGIAVASALVFMMVPRVGWPAKLTSLIIAVGAPVIARLLDPLLAPIASVFS